MTEHRPPARSRAGSGRLPWSSRGGAHRAAPEGRRLLRTLAALAVVALVTVLLLRPWTTEELPRADEPERTATTALVRWTQAQLPPGTGVAIPDGLLDDVVAAGGDPDRFRPPGAEAADALLLVPAEPPAGSLVVARFPGADDTALTVVDRSPGRPTQDELARRQRLSAAILGNSEAGVTGRAADVLRRAHVDPRLLGLLAVLVTQLDVGIADLPPANGEGLDGPLVRSALVDGIGTEVVGPGRAATDRLLAFLDAQIAPFAPDTVAETDEGVLISFRYESAPDALVTASAP